MGKRGPEKKTRFLADGLAYCRLPGPLRVPPLAICVPPTHAEHTTLGGHPTCSACTLGPRGVHVAQGARDECRLSRAHTVGGSSGQTQEKVTEYIKPGKREPIRLDQLLSQMHTAFCQCFP